MRRIQDVVLSTQSSTPNPSVVPSCRVDTTAQTGHFKRKRAICGAAMNLSKASRLAIRCGVGLALLGAGYYLLMPKLFSACACASAEAEARTYIGSLLRAQQAHYFEHEAFAPSLEALNQSFGMGIRSDTEHYHYSIRLESELPTIFAIAKTSDAKSYVGKVALLEDSGIRTNTGAEIKGTATILCEAETTKSELVPPFINEAGQLECSPGSVLR